MSANKLDVAKNLALKVKNENIGSYSVTVTFVDSHGNPTGDAEVNVTVRRRTSGGMIKLSETRQDAAPMSLFGSSACPCCGK